MCLLRRVGLCYFSTILPRSFVVGKAESGRQDLELALISLYGLAGCACSFCVCVEGGGGGAKITKYQCQLVMLSERNGNWGLYCYLAILLSIVYYSM